MGLAETLAALGCLRVPVTKSADLALVDCCIPLLNRLHARLPLLTIVVQIWALDALTLQVQPFKGTSKWKFVACGRQMFGLV